MCVVRLFIKISTVVAFSKKVTQISESVHKSAFRDALSLGYDWPLSNQPSHCACGHSFSIDHSLSCPTGGYPSIIFSIIIRHNYKLVRKWYRVIALQYSTFSGAVINDWKEELRCFNLMCVVRLLIKISTVAVTAAQFCVWTRYY